MSRSYLFVTAICAVAIAPGPCGRSQRQHKEPQEQVLPRRIPLQILRVE